MSGLLTDEEREAVRNMAYAGSYPQEKAARYVRTVEAIIDARVRAAKVEALREAADDFATGAWAEAFLTGEVVDDESAVRATEAWFLARADRIEEDR